jgi:hypothetical protein
MNTVSDQDRANQLVATLTGCLAELDRIEAHIAGAHLDSALQALRRQFDLPSKASTLE